MLHSNKYHKLGGLRCSTNSWFVHGTITLALASFKVCLQDTFQAFATYKSYNISNEMQKCIVIEAHLLQLQPLSIA
jgi:hypothetical protein